MSKENLQKIVVLGMGGTIAGVASDPQKPKEYKAGTLGVADLIDRLGLSNAVQIDVQNVAQINSKDMKTPHWQALLSAVDIANQDPQTRAVVITHGTDTLEETACLLEAMGPWSKPVVLTCAMLPANAPDATRQPHRRLELGVTHPALRGVCSMCRKSTFVTRCAKTDH